MKFGGFKIGKSKEKSNAQENPEAEIIEGAQEDDVPVRHNAPIQELSLDAERTTEEADIVSAEEPEESAEEEEEAVKMVEVQVEASTGSAEAKPDDSNVDLSTSISNIFENVEDDENPLANLIKTLPEVSAAELIDDLKEISEIIKDWQKK